MKAIFISDAHLRKAGDERYKKLLKFFDAVQAGHVMTAADPGAKSGRTLIDHLYIAGDLFDFWFCPKEKINPEFKPVIDKLKEMKNNNDMIISISSTNCIGATYIPFLISSFFNHNLKVKFNMDNQSTEEIIK